MDLSANKHSGSTTTVLTNGVWSSLSETRVEIWKHWHFLAILPNLHTRQDYNIKKLLDRCCNYLYEPVSTDVDAAWVYIDGFVCDLH